MVFNYGVYSLVKKTSLPKFKEGAKHLILMKLDMFCIIPINVRLMRNMFLL